MAFVSGWVFDHFHPSPPETDAINEIDLGGWVRANSDGTFAKPGERSNVSELRPQCCFCEMFSI
jgi:hypothetical protein